MLYKQVKEKIKLTDKIDGLVNHHGDVVVFGVSDSNAFIRKAKFKLKMIRYILRHVQDGSNAQLE